MDAFQHTHRKGKILWSWRYLGIRQAMPHDGMREPELSHEDSRGSGGKSEHGACTVHLVPGVCYG